MAKENTIDEKQKAFEEMMFKKKWHKYLKLSPLLNHLSKDVGKGPKCGVGKKKVEPVKEIKGRKK